MRTALRTSWELSRRLLECPWGAWATRLVGSWPLLARPGWPKIGFGTPLGRAKAVPSASGRVPEADLGAPNGPNSIFHRFGLDFDWIFIDFRPIFRRFSSEPRASKTRKQNLKKKSRDPQRTSWLLRCAVASCCSRIFRNDFRTLRVQPFFAAYPQAHLVSHKITKKENGNEGRGTCDWGGLLHPLRFHFCFGFRFCFDLC